MEKEKRLEDLRKAVRYSDFAAWTFEAGPLKFGVPEYMRESLIGYRTYGRPVGSFLERVLVNDFVGAVGKADIENMRNLPAYVFFLYYFMPAGSWGSEQKVKDWMESGGLPGRMAKKFEDEGGEITDDE